MFGVAGPGGQEHASAGGGERRPPTGSTPSGHAQPESLDQPRLSTGAQPQRFAPHRADQEQNFQGRRHWLQRARFHYGHTHPNQCVSTFSIYKKLHYGWNTF